MQLKAAQVIELLALAGYPTCGYMGASFRVPTSAPPPELGGRGLGGALYFPVTAERNRDRQAPACPGHQPAV